MQNKSAVLIFTVLLALATLYTLSFNYFSSQFENEAQVQGVYEAEQLLDAGQITDAQFDATAAKEAKDFLRAKGDSAIVPVIGKTYREAKERELNLGLDLRGGMSVTLEVSIPDLVIALADYSTNEQFRAAVDQAKADRRNSNADFITLFGQAWAAQGGDVELWRIFHNMENRDLFPAEEHRRRHPRHPPCRSRNGHQQHREHHPEADRPARCGPAQRAKAVLQRPHPRRAPGHR